MFPDVLPHSPAGVNSSKSVMPVHALCCFWRPFRLRRSLSRVLRSVRTLCDHTGTGSELSFCKGEELVVLGGVNQDWIRCRQGDKEGLVPIGYTSLIM
uniref:SH3 domain-containing protein n=1 Tax=Mola mola TaxID=94237 RepID=A0A3Q3VRH6_MOLML